MVRDDDAIWIATNRGLDNRPIVMQAPLIFKRGYYGTTDAFSHGINVTLSRDAYRDRDYDDIHDGYIRYYPSNFRSRQQYYNRTYQRDMDVQEPICQISGWNRQMDDERLQKAWLLSDYSTYLNRYEYTK